MAVFSMRYVTISMRMFAEILTVAQALEKTERLFNLKELSDMETKINIAEILKDKPKGTKLYDLLRNIDVELDKVHTTDVGTYIECTSTNEVGSTLLFDYSKLGTEKCWLDGLQILLPSKEMRDWSKLAWNTGDILVNKDGNAHVIFEGFDDDTYETFNGNNYLWKNEGITMCFGEYEDELPTSDFCKANKEDAQKYIHQIEKRLGYKLNFETLEIEKKTKFKDGDIAFADYGNRQDIFIVSEKTKLSEGYSSFISLDLRGLTLSMGCRTSFFKKDLCKLRLATEEEKQQLFDALAKEGKAWDAKKKMIVDLKPNVDELKPFDKVLVKDNPYGSWEPAIFWKKVDAIDLHPYMVIGGKRYRFCEPYEGNEHFLND